MPKIPDGAELTLVAGIRRVSGCGCWQAVAAKEYIASAEFSEDDEIVLTGPHRETEQEAIEDAYLILQTAAAHLKKADPKGTTVIVPAYTVN